MREFRTQPPACKTYVPSPTQKMFHQSKATYRTLLGGYQGGKTLAGGAEVMMLALQDMPGSLGVVTRSTYPGLEETAKRMILWFARDLDVVKTFHDKKNKLTLKNGSEILFRNGERKENLQGLTLHWWWADEATEMLEEVLLELFGRMSGGLKPRGILTTNPKGHDHVWRLFMRDAVNPKESAEFNRGKDPEFEFLMMPVTENEKNLPPNFISNLIKNYPQKWVDRYVYAKLNDFEGRVFSDFQESIHEIDAEKFDAMRLDNGKNWTFFRGIDHGIKCPTVCIWFAADEYSDLYAYEEYYETDRTVKENSAAIMAIEPGFEGTTLIDPSTNRREGPEGKRIYDAYIENGIYAIQADNSISASIDKINTMLKNVETGSHPGLFMVRGRVPKLKEEFTNYHYPEPNKTNLRNVTEKPVGVKDHGVDVCRYVASYYWSIVGQEINQERRDRLAEIAYQNVKALMETGEIDRSRNYERF